MGSLSCQLSDFNGTPDYAAKFPNSDCMYSPGVIVDLQSWPQEEFAKEEDSPSLIVLETDEGIIKLEMNDDANYKLWSMTINHMLMLSSSYGGY